MLAALLDGPWMMLVTLLPARCDVIKLVPSCDPECRKGSLLASYLSGVAPQGTGGKNAMIPASYTGEQKGTAVPCVGTFSSNACIRGATAQPSVTPPRPVTPVVPIIPMVPVVPSVIPVAPPTAPATPEPGQRVPVVILNTQRKKQPQVAAPKKTGKPTRILLVGRPRIPSGLIPDVYRPKVPASTGIPCVGRGVPQSGVPCVGGGGTPTVAVPQSSNQYPVYRITYQQPGLRYDGATGLLLSRMNEIYSLILEQLKRLPMRVEKKPAPRVVQQKPVCVMVNDCLRPAQGSQSPGRGGQPVPGRRIGSPPTRRSNPCAPGNPSSNPCSPGNPSSRPNPGNNNPGGENEPEDEDEDGNNPGESDGGPSGEEPYETKPSKRPASGNPTRHGRKPEPKSKSEPEEKEPRPPYVSRKRRPSSHPSESEDFNQCNKTSNPPFYCTLLKAGRPRSEDDDYREPEIGSPVMYQNPLTPRDKIVYLSDILNSLKGMHGQIR
jgi:hypothetical protein